MEDFNKTLQNLEDALSNGTINEGQYLQLMNMAKKRWEKQNDKNDHENEEVDPDEYEELDRIDQYIMLKVCDVDAWIIGEFCDEGVGVINQYNSLESATTAWNNRDFL